jgi:hypothetical protein
MDSRQQRPYLGHPGQLAGIRHFEMKSGKAKGVEVFEVTTGGGLQYAVFKDRCLDLGWASFKGVNFSYMGSPGLVDPAYFDAREDGFLESFFCGLLTTCGLASAGAPCVDEGQALGLHGRIGNVPAEESGFETTDGVDGPGWRIHGRMREAKFFGVNLALTREITSRFGGNRICIHDRVENLGFAPQPIQMLYHINFGYPLLCEDSELVLPARSVAPRDARAAEGLGEHLIIEPPQAGYQEQCFYLDLKTDEEGYAFVAILNERLGFGVYERIRKDTLPRFVQWKQMGQGAYVMGLEPGNCLPDGRKVERERGNLRYLAGQEALDMELEIGVLDGTEDLARFRAKMGGLR